MFSSGLVGCLFVWGVLVFYYHFVVLDCTFQSPHEDAASSAASLMEAIFVAFAVSTNCRRNLEGETSPQNCPQTIQQHQQASGI